MSDSTARLDELIEKHRAEFKMQFGDEATRTMWPAIRKMLDHAYYTGQASFARSLARSFRTQRSSFSG